jgi:hypothetical protein
MNDEVGFTLQKSTFFIQYSLFIVDYYLFFLLLYYLEKVGFII